MYWHLNWITNLWKFSSPICKSYWMFRNVANLKAKHGNKQVASISIRRKTHKVSPWKQFYHSRATKNNFTNSVTIWANGADIFASVSLFNISELENFKIHCLKTFRVACAVLLYCRRAFVERSSVRQTVNLGIFKPWKIEKMNTLQTYISSFNFELSHIFEKSVPWASRGWQS